MTGRMRDCSSAGEMGVALGRVDSPPMSRMSAPSSRSLRAWVRASALGGVEVAAVGEGVGGEVEDAHDEGSGAEREGAGAEVPVVGGAWGA